MLDLIGRIHILILHLPIGILLLGVVFEWLHYLKLTHLPHNVRSLTFGLGSLGALSACISGYILSTSGDYNYNLIVNHQWTGVVTTILAFATWGTIILRQYKLTPWLALISAVGLSTAGHLGGTITHGGDFLSIKSLADRKSSNPIFSIDNIPNAKVYKDIIHPILDAKCIQCHGSSKMKGKLRMDTYESMIKGGKSEIDLLSIIEGQSELINRLDLPESSDEHMPPIDKKQLTKDERIIIGEWIDQGYSAEVTVSELENKEANITLITNIIEASKIQNSQQDGATIPADIPEIELTAISNDKIIEIKNQGIVILPAGEDSPFLELNFVNLKNITPEHWRAIEAIAPNILRLKLSDLNVTDENLKQIAKMKHLTKLHLDNTEISDEGLSLLKELQYLNYLNLNKTNISNRGIESLNKLERLKSIFAFQTNVSIDQLQSDLNVETGNYKLEFYPNDTIRIPQS